MAKGIKFLIQYFSTSASLRANREHDDIERDQIQQQQQQNEGTHIAISFYLVFIPVWALFNTVSGGEQTTGRYTPEPQCDSIENEQGT